MKAKLYDLVVSHINGDKTLHDIRISENGIDVSNMLKDITSHANCQLQRLYIIRADYNPFILMDLIEDCELLLTAE